MFKSFEINEEVRVEEYVPNALLYFGIVARRRGVFELMKVVEKLADNYHVALLNSKNAWRILGQESYSYEIAQEFDFDMGNKAVLLPIGNAGNITAVMS